MGVYTILLPDIGEGIAEAELSEWNIKIGDIVREDDILGSVMTDKVAVEIPSVVSGTINWLAGDIGDFIAVGEAYVKLYIAGEGNNSEADDTRPAPIDHNNDPIKKIVEQDKKPMASPSIRKRARDENIDLDQIVGTGPQGRISEDDLELYIAKNSSLTSGAELSEEKNVTTIKVVGMRREIAKKMSLANASIPHITIIEEIDVEVLEELRTRLNNEYSDQREKLTLLPFIMGAIVKAVAEQPQINAHFDDKAGIIHQYGNVHIGIATQTENGLLVPVIKHAKNLTLWQSAKEISRLAALVRSGKAIRDQLSGSTITISSLGSLGAIATTPIINHPEVAIVGINKIAVRPMWDGQQFQPRKMMNISCSFDHRIIDGWDAALFVQNIKTRLETPANLLSAE